ncbi:MAG: TRAP transporter small permease [Dehalococcoidia bacterium]|nr:TRAP transporter small permease [Dehalococcoidia bacterium]
MGRLVKIWNFFVRLTGSLTFVAGILLLFMTLSVCYTVITRYLHLNPPIWTIQVSEYILLWITFLAAAWLLRKGGHVRIDAVVSRLSPKAQRILNIIVSIFGAVVCAVIAWFGGQNTWDLLQRGIIDVKTIDVPKFGLFLVIPLGSFLLLVQFIRNVYTYLLGRETGE